MTTMLAGYVRPFSRSTGQTGQLIIIRARRGAIHPDYELRPVRGHLVIPGLEV